MSFNRLNYDACTYQTNLTQSVGPCDYLLNTPTIECQKCLTVDSHMIPQTSGVSTCDDISKMTDVNSELLGITRKATNCPTGKYSPNTQQSNLCTPRPLADCKAVVTEDTRLSNPPHTLRCTGWNRWEWLCHDPQSKAIMPFEHNVSYRRVVKDNHRPCIQTPINQAPLLPPGQFVETEDPIYSPPEGKHFDTIPSTHWRKCPQTYVSS
jgi:hypothetical protein